MIESDTLKSMDRLMIDVRTRYDAWVLKTNASTLTATVYADVRRDLLTGRLEPGSRVKVSDLNKQYGVSLSVAREALTRLAEQNLLVMEPQRGFRVAELTVGDLHELTEARTLLECFVLDRAITQGDRNWEGRIIATHHVLSITAQLDPDGTTTDEWTRAHNDFHIALLDGCDNRRLQVMATSLREQGELYRLWAGSLTGERGRDVAAEHRELMDATLSRNSQRATAALAQHIQLTSRILSAFLEQKLSQRVGAGPTRTGTR